jgi:hypothetical protein
MVYWLTAHMVEDRPEVLDAFPAKMIRQAHSLSRVSSRFGWSNSETRRGATRIFVTFLILVGVVPFLSLFRADGIIPKPDNWIGSFSRKSDSF